MERVVPTRLAVQNREAGVGGGSRSKSKSRSKRGRFIVQQDLWLRSRHFGLDAGRRADRAALFEAIAPAAQL